jgi:hypothetical protein
MQSATGRAEINGSSGARGFLWIVFFFCRDKPISEKYPFPALFFC